MDLDPDSAIFVCDVILQKQVLNKSKSRKIFFFPFFLDRRIRIRTCDKWIRIREAQKHLDHTDTGIEFTVSVTWMETRQFVSMSFQCFQINKSPRLLSLI